MTVFGPSYSRYYDLLYKDKDYETEAGYIDRIIQSSRPGAGRLLEMGSGTGKHAALLAAQGYSVCGIEQSGDMLSIAKQREDGSSLRFIRGDMRTVRLDERFDVVFSLFHVVNYLNRNEDLLEAFQNASAHLEEGGLFIFDSWYGPAVLTDRPAVRVKRWEDEESRVIRLAEPVMSVNRNTVEVNYQVLLHDKKSGHMDEWKETHRMRYLFTPEIEMMLDRSGMELESCCEFMTGRDPGERTWSVLYIGRKR
ncbi:class I SAM-dependent DNA methyltransferase [Paenibacillus humicola]|uniref:class I SAM-dependent DNA methyltransferase n=1 Tax=Paenibacillus humicola TaxID=3110540 RepID=UPI00237A0C3D|nr:class I SAM-dependent methyltransferase [Paenibacillus humicola]